MAIEFSCPGCQKSLRVAETAAGKQARCPGCGTIMVVPPATAPAGPTVPTGGGSAGMGPPRLPVPPTPAMPPQRPQPPFQSQTSYSQQPQPQSQPQLQPVVNPFAQQPGGRPYDSGNPFQSPQANMPVDYGTGAGAGNLPPTRFDLSEIFSRAWTLFGQNALNCILVFFLQGALGLVAYFAFVMFIGIGQRAMGPGIAILLIPGFIGFIALAVWLHCGSINFNLKVARGEAARLEDLFSGSNHVLAAFLSGLVLGLIVFVAVICVEIPVGAIALLAAFALGPKAAILFVFLMYIAAFIAEFAAFIAFGQHLYLIVDKKVGVIDSFNESWRLTKGKLMPIALIYVIEFFISVIGVCACGVGTLIAAPLVALISAVMYVALTGPTGSADEEPMPVLTPLR
jgi:uncharacterized membrane protein